MRMRKTHGYVRRSGWGQYVAVFVQSPTPSHTQPFQIKWEVYFSKELCPFVIIIVLNMCMVAYVLCGYTTQVGEPNMTNFGWAPYYFCTVVTSTRKLLFALWLEKCVMDIHFGLLCWVMIFRRETLSFFFCGGVQRAIEFLSSLSSQETNRFQTCFWMQYIYFSCHLPCLSNTVWPRILFPDIQEVSHTTF